MIKQQLKSMLIYMLASPSSWLSAWTPFQLVLPLSSLFYVQNFYCSLHLLKRAPGDCSVFQPRLWTAALMSVHHRVSLLKRNAKPLSSDKSWAEAETSLQRSITRFTPPAASQQHLVGGWWSTAVWTPTNRGLLFYVLWLAFSLLQPLLKATPDCK